MEQRRVPSSEAEIQALTLDQYQSWLRHPAPVAKKYALLYFSNAFVGEAGEVANEVKKLYRDGFDNYRVVDELGDALHYLAMTATAVGVPLSEVARKNLIKVTTKYSEFYANPAAQATKAE